VYESDTATGLGFGLPVPVISRRDDVSGLRAERRLGGFSPTVSVVSIDHGMLHPQQNFAVGDTARPVLLVDERPFPFNGSYVGVDDRFEVFFVFTECGEFGFKPIERDITPHALSPHGYDAVLFGRTEGQLATLKIGAIDGVSRGSGDGGGHDKG